MAADTLERLGDQARRLRHQGQQPQSARRRDGGDRPWRRGKCRAQADGAAGDRQVRSAGCRRRAQLCLGRAGRTRAAISPRARASSTQSNKSRRCSIEPYAARARREYESVSARDRTGDIDTQVAKISDLKALCGSIEANLQTSLTGQEGLRRTAGDWKTLSGAPVTDRWPHPHRPLRRARPRILHRPRLRGRTHLRSARRGRQAGPLRLDRRGRALRRPRRPLSRRQCPGDRLFDRRLATLFRAESDQLADRRGAAAARAPSSSSCSTRISSPATKVLSQAFARRRSAPNSTSGSPA